MQAHVIAGEKDFLGVILFRLRCVLLLEMVFGRPRASNAAAAEKRREQTSDVPEMPMGPDAEVRSAIQRIAEGDAEAFEIITTRHRDNVFRTAWRMTNNFDDAMDVTQEVFIRVFYALRSWKGRVRFSTWLNRIVCNTAIDYIRRQRRSSRYTERALENVSSDDASPEIQTAQPAAALTNAELNELRQILHEAISRLSGQQRRCFVLRHYQELSIKEIADSIGCSQGSVKQHLYRAMIRLRAILCKTLNA
jgi:RNA polymerase sigma-70 factor (ECF subfamily)